MSPPSSSPQVILRHRRRRRPEPSHVTSSQFAAYFSLQQFRNSHLRAKPRPRPSPPSLLPYLYLLEQRPSGLSGAVLAAAAAALNQTTCEEEEGGKEETRETRGVFATPNSAFSIAPCRHHLALFLSLSRASLEHDLLAKWKTEAWPFETCFSYTSKFLRVKLRRLRAQVEASASASSLPASPTRARPPHRLHLACFRFYAASQPVSHLVPLPPFRLSGATQELCAILLRVAAASAPAMFVQHTQVALFYATRLRAMTSGSAPESWLTK